MEAGDNAVSTNSIYLQLDCRDFRDHPWAACGFIALVSVTKLRQLCECSACGLASSVSLPQKVLLLIVAQMYNSCGGENTTCLKIMLIHVNIIIIFLPF